jgi:hypothetical protein
MNDPEQLKAELSRIFHEVTSKDLSAVSFEDRVEPLIDEFYNDVYEEGFGDGYDNCDGGSGDSDTYDTSPSGRPEDPEY